MYVYTPWQWLAFFYIYCFFGWMFESTYVSLKERHPVNRGFLHLPMLPLYGTGAVMMLWVSLPFKNSLVLVYIAGVFAATILEYITGYAMEQLFKMKYWDYSGQKFQIHGYICLSSSIAWGFLTIFLTEVVHRPIEQVVLGLSPSVLILVLIPVTCLFLIDVSRSTKAALDLGRLLESMTRMRSEMEELQVQLALLKGETSQFISEIREETSMKMAELREETRQKLSELKDNTTTKAVEEIQEKLSLLSDKRLQISERLGAHKAYIFRNNPSASSGRFADAFRELKETLNMKKK